MAARFSPPTSSLGKRLSPHKPYWYNKGIIRISQPILAAAFPATNGGAKSITKYSPLADLFLVLLFR